jgi:hypothetical protein
MNSEPRAIVTWRRRRVSRPLKYYSPTSGSGKTMHATRFRHKRLNLRGWFIEAAVAAKPRLDLIKGWGREKPG